jgi:hypothetical protein
MKRTFDNQPTPWQGRAARIGDEGKAAGFLLAGGFAV